MNNTNEELFKGRISAIHKNNYTIRFEGKDIPARLKGSFYDLMTDRFPVVGDYVSFEYNPIGDSLIVSVLECSGLLQRPDQAKTGVMQYMVANVDYTFIVTSLIGIIPELKRKGYGKAILDYSLEKATEMGFGAVLFEGNIGFYGHSGFDYASKFGIRYHDLPEDADVEEFDKNFPPKEKLKLPGQLFE